ncbi:SRPBCC domain-containing protein [Actinomadura sp. DC4]|uniref:SRPBCC domain-containing protein n=1 Tax=Actinomadura sp. DC4 TaxID=3055069 RepID=UPI0025B1FF0E|nr:SRPBCC domain-containing protein [Actinomadura sp. DC4]MDN3356198.1 SRPBCC domain-containing protein [Actinomadura sp. DC4]
MFRRLIAGILAPVIVLVGFYLWGNGHPYTVTRSVEIAASAAKVWDVLTDLPAYDHWNPEITSAEGHLAKDATLTLRVRSGGGTDTVRPSVTIVTPGRELRWQSRFRDIGHLADGEQRFTIEAAGPDRVRFTQAQTFRGIAVPFMHGTLASSCSRFDAMNAALKTRAESKKG